MRGIMTKQKKSPTRRGDRGKMQQKREETRMSEEVKRDNAKKEKVTN